MNPAAGDTPTPQQPPQPHQGPSHPGSAPLPPPGASRSGDTAASRRNWLLALGAGLLVAAVAGLIVLAQRSSSTDDSCFGELAAYLDVADGEDVFISGSDFARARKTDLDATEAETIQFLEAGVLIDPWTRVIYEDTLDPEVPTRIGGWETSQISCWVGHGSDLFARGDFDVDTIEDTHLAERGRTAATSDLLGHSGIEGFDPLTDLQENRHEDLAKLVEALDSQEAVTFTFRLSGEEQDSSEPLNASALAYDDGWHGMALWVFPDDTAAAKGEDDLVAELAANPEILDDEREPLDVADPTEGVDRDGSLLVLRVPLDGPEHWGIRHADGYNFNAFFSQ